MDPESESPQAKAPPRMERKRRFFSPRSGRQTMTGQAIVEFSIVSIAFFLMVFGTIDFGRAIYMYSQLHNAVREGARYGKMNPTDSTGIKGRVTDYASSFDIASDDITVDCTGGCSSGSTDVKVSASASLDRKSTRLNA